MLHLNDTIAIEIIVNSPNAQTSKFVKCATDNAQFRTKTTIKFKRDTTDSDF